MDAAGHEALLIVDTVSSLASIQFRMDEWGVDVVICGSQKGLMLPPGLGILGVSRRALERGARSGGSPRHFWDWEPIMRENRIGLFPYTPATLMLFGLREALRMLVDEEGLDNVYARHQRLADAVRAAVRGWGLSHGVRGPAYASNTITAVRTPEGVDSNVAAQARARALRAVAGRRHRRAQRPGVPHRASWLAERARGAGHARRRRAGLQRSGHRRRDGLGAAGRRSGRSAAPRVAERELLAVGGLSSSAGKPTRQLRQPSLTRRRRNASSRIRPSWMLSTGPALGGVMPKSLMLTLVVALPLTLCRSN